MRTRGEEGKNRVSDPRALGMAYPSGAVAKVPPRRHFTEEQHAWLDRVRVAMLANLAIDREDFNWCDAFSRR